MQLTWHLLVIIAAVLFGVCLFQRGEKTPNMTAEQATEADQHRMWAYVLWSVAAGVAVWYYMGENKQKATMCGAGAVHYGNMHRGAAHMYGPRIHHGKATMCGAKH